MENSGGFILFLTNPGVFFSLRFRRQSILGLDEFCCFYLYWQLSPNSLSIYVSQTVALVRITMAKLRAITFRSLLSHPVSLSLPEMGEQVLEELSCSAYLELYLSSWRRNCFERLGTF